MEALQMDTFKGLDRKAFKLLYEEYHQILLNRFASLIGSQQRAEDILQEVFLKVWLQRRNISVDLSLKAYLFRIGHNLIMDYYRHHKVEKRFALRQNRYNKLSFIDEDELFQEDRLSCLEKIIDKLPPRRRQIFRLCKFEGKSYRDASVLLDVSESTISDHIVKANRFIKNEFERKNYSTYSKADA